MTGDLFSLAYFSRNRIEGSAQEVGAEIAGILDAARENNRRAGITGALLFSGGRFAQVLEGPRSALEDLFETIECDPRHSDVIILHFHPIEARSFGDWSMAYAGQSDAARDHAVEADALGSPDQIEAGAPGQAFLSMLHDYIRRDEQAAAHPGPASPTVRHSQSA